jgi:hypothetical protein
MGSTGLRYVKLLLLLFLPMLAVNTLFAAQNTIQIPSHLTFRTSIDVPKDFKVRKNIFIELKIHTRQLTDAFFPLGNELEHLSTQAQKDMEKLKVEFVSIIKELKRKEKDIMVRNSYTAVEIFNYAKLLQSSHSLYLQATRHAGG